jgi:hypothetical protein
MREVPEPTGAVADMLRANGELDKPFGGKAELLLKRSPTR